MWSQISSSWFEPQISMNIRPLLHVSWLYLKNCCFLSFQTAMAWLLFGLWWLGCVAIKGLIQPSIVVGIFFHVCNGKIVTHQYALWELDGLESLKLWCDAKSPCGCRRIRNMFLIFATYQKVLMMRLLLLLLMPEQVPGIKIKGSVVAEIVLVC